MMGPSDQILDGPEALLGRVIAGYRLVKYLGGGGTGVVFQGVDAQSVTKTGMDASTTDKQEEGHELFTDDSSKTSQDTDRPHEVAIKILALPWQLDAKERAELRARFTREIQTLRRLEHPHILGIIDDGEQGGLSYMVLPYLAGGRITHRLARGRLPLADVARYIEQVAEALDYAHSKGVIHRDVKPENILLDSEDNAFLADFSIARVMEGTRTKLTRTGLALGSTAYMAPEQLYGGKVGEEADIYSLGVVLFELVTGQIPFDGETEYELRHKIEYELPPSPQQLRPDLLEPAVVVILQALAKQPEQRFGSASDLARSFSAGIEGQWDEAVRRFTPVQPKKNSQPSVSASSTILGGWSSSEPSVTSSRYSPKIPAWIAITGLIALTLVTLGIFTSLKGLGSSRTLGAIKGSPTQSATVGKPQKTATSGTQLPVTNPTATLVPAPTATLTPDPAPLSDQAQVSNSGAGEQNQGATFSVTFTATNDGTTTWSPSSDYVFVCLANCYGAGTQQLNRNVAPGQNASFNVNMTAPNGGTNILNQNFSQSTSIWQMQHNGAAFGNQSSVPVATHGWTTAYGPTTPCAGSNGWTQFRATAGCGSLQTTSTFYPEMDLQGWLVSNTGLFRMETHVNLTTNNSGNYEPGLVIDTPQAPALGGAEFGARANGTWTVWKCCSGNIPVVVAQSAVSPSTSYDLAVVIYGGTAHFYLNGNEVFSTATGNLNLNGNQQGVIQWWNVHSSNDTSSWSNFQVANWG